MTHLLFVYSWQEFIYFWLHVSDVDECVPEVNPCEQVCTNQIGSFVCSCNDGYVVDPVDSNKCKGKVKVISRI